MKKQIVKYSNLKNCKNLSNKKYVRDFFMRIVAYKKFNRKVIIAVAACFLLKFKPFNKSKQLFVKEITDVLNEVNLKLKLNNDFYWLEKIISRKAKIEQAFAECLFYNCFNYTSVNWATAYFGYVLKLHECKPPDNELIKRLEFKKNWDIVDFSVLFDALQEDKDSLIINYIDKQTNTSVCQLNLWSSRLHQQISAKNNYDLAKLVFDDLHLTFLLRNAIYPKKIAENFSCVFENCL
jgi:hypothetical protein